MPQKIMPLTILTNALPDDSLILPDSPESINLDGDIIDNIVTLPMAIKEEEYIKGKFEMDSISMDGIV